MCKNYCFLTRLLAVSQTSQLFSIRGKTPILSGLFACKVCRYPGPPMAAGAPRIRSVFPQKRRCPTGNQCELFQRVSEQRPKSAGNHGARGDCVQYGNASALVGWEEASRAVTYLFLGFGLLYFNGPLIASGSRASRTKLERFSFGGNASGWPRFHSVVLPVDPLVFLAMRSLSHVQDRLAIMCILREPWEDCRQSHSSRQ